MEKTLMEGYAKALNAVRNPRMDGENPHFRSKYATLPEVQRRIREACCEVGIAYAQSMSLSDGATVLESRVVGGEGELALSVFPVSLPPNPQQAGSALTYAKRQLACIDWGISGDDDDDANGAAPKPAADGVRAASAELAEAARKYAAATGRDDAAGVYAEIKAAKGREGFDAMGPERQERWLRDRAADYMTRAVAKRGNEEERF